MFLKKALLRPSSIKTELKDILCDNTTEKAVLSCNMLWLFTPAIESGFPFGGGFFGFDFRNGNNSVVKVG